MVDWSKPLRIKGTDRAARVVSGLFDNSCYRMVAADWHGDGSQRAIPVLPSGVASEANLGKFFELENIPEPAADPDLNLLIAREAAARVCDSRGWTGDADEIRRGDGDDIPTVQSALLAFTEGGWLLESPEPAASGDAYFWLGQEGE